MLLSSMSQKCFTAQCILHLKLLLSSPYTPQCLYSIPLDTTYIVSRVDWTDVNIIAYCLSNCMCFAFGWSPTRSYTLRHNTEYICSEVLLASFPVSLFFPRREARFARGRKKKGLVQTVCTCVSLSPEFWGSRFFRNLSAQNNAMKWAWSYLKLALQCMLVLLRTVLGSIKGQR